MMCPFHFLYECMRKEFTFREMSREFQFFGYIQSSILCSIITLIAKKNISFWQLFFLSDNILLSLLRNYFERNWLQEMRRQIFVRNTTIEVLRLCANRWIGDNTRRRGNVAEGIYLCKKGSFHKVVETLFIPFEMNDCDCVHVTTYGVDLSRSTYLNDI